jgi:hypothetical protein
MRHARRLGPVRWWSAVPVLLVAGGFTVIGIAGDTTRRPNVPALAGEPSKDGGAPAEPSARREQSHEEDSALVRYLRDESRRDATER